MSNNFINFFFLQKNKMTTTNSRKWNQEDTRQTYGNNKYSKPYSDINVNIIPPLKIGEQQQEGSLSHRLKNLYESKEQNYKLTMQELINQNQSLKFYIKKLTTRLNHLHGKLKLFLSDEEINLESLNIQDQNQEKISQLQNLLVTKANNLKHKYQKMITTILQYYGCTNQESNISKFINEQEIIQFLLQKFNSKAKDLRNYDNEMRNKISQYQQQILKQKESIKYLNQNTQLFRLKQMKYKEKLDQIKEQWSALCEKLTKKDFQIQKLNHELYALKAKQKQYEVGVKSFEKQTKEKGDANVKQVKILQAKIIEMSNKIAQSSIKYQQLYNSYEEAQILIKQLQVNQKNNQEQIEKSQRDSQRWKERYEWLQKERMQNITSVGSQTQRLKYQALKQKFKITKNFEENNDLGVFNIKKESQNYKIIEPASSSNYASKSNNLNQINKSQIQQRIKRRQQELQKKGLDIVTATRKEELVKQLQNKLKKSQEKYYSFV